MPKYDYNCDNCGTIELDKSMTSPHPTECPDCGTPGLRRVFNTPSVQILGDHYVRDRTPPPPDRGVTIQPRSS